MLGGAWVRAWVKPSGRAERKTHPERDERHGVHAEHVDPPVHPGSEGRAVSTGGASDCSQNWDTNPTPREGVRGGRGGDRNKNRVSVGFGAAFLRDSQTLAFRGDVRKPAFVKVGELVVRRAGVAAAVHHHVNGIVLWGRRRR